MTTETPIECRHCEGTGQIDPTDHLDLGSIEALRAELIYLVNSNEGGFGLTAGSQADRLLTLGRIGFIASRMVWLESTDMLRTEFAKKIVDGKVAAGELAFTPAGGLVDTKS